MTDAPGVALLVDDLFRRSAGEIAAVLLRRSGGSSLEVEAAEDAVQEAFVQALRTWPYKGVPSNPRGWLYRVAHRRALDAHETHDRRVSLLAALRRSGGGATTIPRELPEPDRVSDDELALLLLLCDPGLLRISQVMLTLKLGCGFSVEEIAAAFLCKPATVAQWCVRAKRVIRRSASGPPEPTARLLAERAPIIREVLYLLFSGGHAAVTGSHPVRADLCGEALRLGRLMPRSSDGDTPATRAILALFCLHAARMPARLNSDGVTLPLAEQDRGLWDRGLLAEGFHHLERSARGPDMTRYPLEVSLAAVHAAAPSADETDWDRMVELYDRLLCSRPPSGRSTTVWVKRRRPRPTIVEPCPWRGPPPIAPSSAPAAGFQGEYHRVEGAPGPGTVGWLDLTVEAAPVLRDFYVSVLGWTVRGVSMGDYDDFTMVAADGTPVAGICHARGRNAELPRFWLSYVVVPDLEASLDRVRTEGGEVIQGPGSTEDGRMAVIRDPAGAFIALWAAGRSD